MSGEDNEELGTGALDPAKIAEAAAASVRQTLSAKEKVEKALTLLTEAGLKEQLAPETLKGVGKILFRIIEAQQIGDNYEGVMWRQFGDEDLINALKTLHQNGTPITAQSIGDVCANNKRLAEQNPPAPAAPQALAQHTGRLENTDLINLGIVRPEEAPDAPPPDFESKLLKLETLTQFLAAIGESQPTDDEEPEKNTPKPKEQALNSDFTNTIPNIPGLKEIPEGEPTEFLATPAAPQGLTGLLTSETAGKGPTVPPDPRDVRTLREHPAVIKKEADAHVAAKQEYSPDAPTLNDSAGVFLPGYGPPTEPFVPTPSHGTGGGGGTKDLGTPTPKNAVERYKKRIEDSKGGPEGGFGAKF